MSSSIVNRYFISEVATFATTAPTNGSTWIHVPHIGNERLVKVQEFDDAIQANHLGLTTAQYPTVKGGSFTFRTMIHTGTKAFDGTGGDSNPTSCYAQKLLESYFGVAASAAFTGTTVAAASGAGNTAPLKVASASNLAVGMAIFVGAVDGSAGEVRFITTISGTDITLDQDLSAANYVENSIVYGAFNFSPTLGAYAKQLYLSHIMDGHADLLVRFAVGRRDHDLVDDQGFVGGWHELEKVEGR